MTPWLLLHGIRAFVLDRVRLVAENLALRQQLATLCRSAPRPRLLPRDRCFWVWLSDCFANWPEWLLIVQPATVLAWHRQGFRWFWRWKSRSGGPGRPRIEAAIPRLIRRMAAENPTWGAPRIASELRLLGHEVAESTVARYRPRIRRPRCFSAVTSAFVALSARAAA